MLNEVRKQCSIYLPLQGQISTPIGGKYKKFTFRPSLYNQSELNPTLL